MVYLEPHQLGWKPLLASWVNTLPKSSLGEDIVDHISDLFNWLLPVCLRFLRREMKELSPTEDSNLARTAMNIIYSLLDEFQSVEDGHKPPGTITTLMVTIVYLVFEHYRRSIPCLKFKYFNF